ncbi:phytase [Geodermatophilus sp. DF01-2]|uniref:phytase n=1 Tax=Geodermatophilus sp. DF01-2 TaxID=2559610 RepID=UPI0010739143|nr:phytase [Geodermatophilus sp. DF01_2]TFV64689.1 phytase [Geodermatophilus sp. DF01_2]
MGRHGRRLLPVVAAVWAAVVAGGCSDPGADGDSSGDPADAVPTGTGADAATETPATGDSAGAAWPDEVRATVETEPVPHGGDAADDPAVWVNTRDPAASAVIATDKQGGLLVYDLRGRQLQYLPVGQVNNVDVRPAAGPSGSSTLASRPLVVTGNRSDDSIGVYELDPDTRQLRDVSAGALRPGVEVYGSCLYRSAATDRLYVFVTSKSGRVVQFELFEDGSGRVDGERVRSFDLDSQIEGCVADDELGHLYIAEEEVGIWKYGAEPTDGTEGTPVARVSRSGPLVADVEGLTIAAGPDGTGYLIASSQGDDSYAVYTREDDNDFVTSFQVVGGSGIDGAEDTDGLVAAAAPLGTDFPAGVLVVQDGENDGGNQNFKLVPLDRLLPD